MEDYQIDRLASVFLIEPLRRRCDWSSPGIPMFMYHSVCSREERGSGYYRTVTAPQRFYEHVRHLSDNGFLGVSMSRALALLRTHGEKAAVRTVVFTFDDAYADFYTTAFPILSAHGFTATMFVPTSYVGEQFAGFPCMTWNQIRELSAAGVEFGSHTATHPQLVHLPASRVRNELATSKSRLEDETGIPVRSFAYPYAFPETNVPFRVTFKSMLEDAGYQYGATTTIGRVRAEDDPHFLKRLPISSRDDLRLFGAKLNGSYDWVYRLQHYYKRLKSVASRTAPPCVGRREACD